jgi:hypothetical protein
VCAGRPADKGLAVALVERDEVVHYGL